MKFYIPTSNLNLDNILQSECILPFTHYSHRCSGYKSFEQIDELRSFEAIVLFKYPIQFQIRDTGRYNYPMLIELEDDKQTSDFADKEIQDGVCLCNHRLNLTPLNCRIYFFTENAYKLTLVNTQSNKAIKYFKDYKIYPNVSMLKLVNMPRLKEQPKEISKFEDNLIDKQKGVLYAFLIGNKMSVNRDLARQLRLTQEIYNILTNLISSPSSIASFSAKLSNLLNDYKKVDSVETNSLRKFHENLDKSLGTRFLFLKGCLIDFLKKIECWDLVHDTLCEKWNCPFLPDISKLRTEGDFTILREEIERRTSQATFEYSKGIPSENLNNVYISGDYITFTQAKLVNIVIRYIMANSITPETLSAKRMDVYMSVMTEIVSVLKAEMGEQKWQESEEKAYVNNLYSFINDPASLFDLNSIDNMELKSIAAFILRGQSFKDCIAYLRINEIEDYRFVLSLWGCLCGYMEMNKEVLSDILTIENYKNIYRYLFSYDMYETVWEKEVIDIQTEQRDSVDSEEIESFITSISRNCVKSVEKYKVVYIELFKLYGISYDLLAAIEQNSQIKTGKATVKKNIEKMLVPQKTKGRVKKRDESMSLFQEEIKSVSSHINGYDEALNFIENNAPEQIRKNLKSNLEYIDKEYTGDGKYANTGDDPVKHFLVLCFSMRNKWNRIEETSENRKYVEQICKILSSK